MQTTGFTRTCLVALVAAGSALSVACSTPSAATTIERDIPPPEVDGVVHIAQASRTFIETETVTGALTDVPVTAAARVEFRDGAVSQVGTPLDGRVVMVHVQPGSRVSQGDPLVTLDCPDAAEMRAAVQSATAALREAQSVLERQTRMLREGVGIERDKIAAETRVSEAEATLSRVQANVAFIGTGNGTTVVLRAPISGTVTVRRASVGLAVQKGSDPLVEVGNAAALWIVADVFERDLPTIRETARAAVDLGSVGVMLDGRVASIGPVVASGLRTAPVKINVDTRGVAIRPGMYGSVSIEGEVKDLTLPTEAILIKDGKESVVYIEKDPLTFVRRSVVIAQHSQNGRIQVMSGVSPGEKVVVRGALLLDGSADQLL